MLNGKERTRRTPVGFKRNILLQVIIVILLVVLLIGGIFVGMREFIPHFNKGKFKKMDLTQVNKVMFVAHPDDETLWGGAHLTSGNYLVVCLTDGDNDIRAKEFRDAVKAANETNIPVIMRYPDKTFFMRDNWFGLKGDIRRDIQTIIETKNWDQIVTHNRNGEYGHIHHKLTHKLTVKAYNKLECKDKLMFFGTYHRKSKIAEYEDEMPRISDKLLNKKEENLKIFKSQERVVECLSHMNPYEDWQEYDPPKDEN